MGLPSSTLVLFLSLCCLEMTESTATLRSASASWDLDHISARLDEGWELDQSLSNTTGWAVAFVMGVNGSILMLQTTFGLQNFAEWGPVCEVIINSIHLTGDVLRGSETEATKWFLKVSELSIDELTLVTSEDCTAEFDVTFLEVPDLIRHFLCALLDTLLWIY